MQYFSREVVLTAQGGTYSEPAYAKKRYFVSRDTGLGHVVVLCKCLLVLGLDFSNKMSVSIG